jgi:hypothetical protein
MSQASLMSQVLPQDDDQRIRMPDLPPAGGMGVNYGYTPNNMAMPSSMGMPNLNLQAPEFGIVDPTYLAQLAILNQGGGNFMPAAAPAAPMGLLGAGLESQDQFRPNAPLLGGAPMIADWRAYSPNRSANADLNRAIAMSQSGGGGNGYTDQNPAWTNMSDAQKAAYYRENPTMAGITRLGQKAFSYTTPGLLQGMFNPDLVSREAMIASGYNPDTYTSETGMGMGSLGGGTSFSNPQTIGIQDYGNFGVVQADYGLLSDAPGFSIGNTGMGVADNGLTVSNDATIAAQNAAMFGESAGSESSSASKIVCTAMNHAYGFGGFRNKIWLTYSAKHLTKAHEVGYHTLFLPLVAVGYNQGDKMHNRIVRRVLENIARHRSADLRAEMRGTKRDRVGQAYRFILEPLCYAVGKLKGN